MHVRPVERAQGTDARWRLTAFVRQRIPWQRAALLGTVVAVLLTLGYELIEFGSEIRSWDFLFLSGVVTLLGALWAASGQPGRFRKMRIPARENGRWRKKPPLPRSGGWENGTGIVIMLLLAGLFAYNGTGRVSSAYIVLGAFAGAIGGFLAGRVIGRSVAYSLAVRSLVRSGRAPRPVPGHPDGAGGLRPIGDYFLYQGALLSIPAFFLAGWSLLFFIPELSEKYENWRSTYVALFAGSVIITAFAVFAPLWAVHTHMLRKKQSMLAQADRQVAPEIARLREQLREDQPQATRVRRREKAADLRQEYVDLATMPTWPLNVDHWRKLAVRGTAILVPLVARVAAMSP
jgi:hypothetical protein